MKGFTLYFGPDENSLRPNPNPARKRGAPTGPVDAFEAGRVGVAAPGIASEEWPRSSKTGLPMMHVLTLRLPEHFRRKGADLPGIAFFAGQGQFAEGFERTEGDPFLAQLDASRVHPRFTLLTDIIDGEWGLMWLTEDELSGLTEPPEDVRRTGEHVDTSEGVNAWDSQPAEEKVWLVANGDPNVGTAPTEDDDESDYVDPFDENYGLRDWAEPISGTCHLGGTVFPVQALPDGLTGYVLELEELEHVNLGGGNAQIDLESGAFDWAC
ncbi:hypothetical protein [Brevibacterium samyangense]|uniref:DUF1963 domain-containing protein n=1 Tax=Brevibacterium samyangense TaxID=366888 RepID=A0ABN2TL85_9MICO